MTLPQHSCGRFEDDPLTFLLAGHAQHGPLFVGRLAGRDTAFVATAAGVRQLFAHERGNLDVLNTPLVHDLFGRAVFNLAAAEHQRARRLLLPALHGAVPALAEPLAELADAAVRGWGTRLDDLHAGVQELTHAMSALALLGVAPHDPDDASVHYLFDAFVAATTARPGRLRFASRRYWIGRRARTDLLALFARRRHAPNGGVLPALVGVFDGAGHSAGEVGDHLLALMIAARETTASLITWLLIELASDGTLAERCRSEVRNARSDPGLLARRGGAPTLGAVLAETERLHSPNIISVRRARRDVHLDGFALRAGCRVAYSPAANHLDPVAYPDPYAFRPDRFADGGRARAASLLTFGGGVHACLGRPLAELMTLTAAAAVLRRGRPFLPAGLPGPVRYLPAKAPARPLPFRLDPIGAAR